jgi:hypothetical protein
MTNQATQATQLTGNNIRPKRTAKACREDAGLLDAIIEKHVTAAFSEAWRTLSARNPKGSGERAFRLMREALKRRSDYYAELH